VLGCSLQTSVSGVGNAMGHEFMRKDDADLAGKHKGSSEGSIEQTEGKIARHTKWLVMLFLSCIWGMVFAWGMIMYRDHFNNVSQSLVQMNIAIEAQTRNQLRLIQTVLMAIDGWLVQHPESPVVNETFFDDFIHAGKFRNESGLFINIYAVDFEGNVYDISPDNPEVDGSKPLGEVDGWKYISSKAEETGIYIARPVSGQISEDWVIPVFLPLSVPRNNMQMLMVAIKVDILDRLYEQQRKPTTRIALFHEDGTLLARAPLQKEFLGKNYAKEFKELFQHPEYSIAVVSNTPFDQTKRLISHISLREFPVMVTISGNYDDVLRNFFKNLSVLIILSFVTSVAVLFTGRQQMRLLVEQAHLNARVSRLATTDDLTGIWNRRHFIELMNHEFERSHRYKTPLSLLLFDLDHFKSINDNYGHQVGDETLIIFADTVMKNLRSVDFFSRFGGEEFMVLLPQTSIHMAKHLAERICKIIQQLRIPTEQGEISFSTSVGVAALQSTDTTPDDMMLRADKSLYYAKSNGRNQVGSIELEVI